MLKEGAVIVFFRSTPSAGVRACVARMCIVHGMLLCHVGVHARSSLLFCFDNALPNRDVYDHVVTYVALHESKLAHSEVAIYSWSHSKRYCDRTDCTQTRRFSHCRYTHSHKRSHHSMLSSTRRCRAGQIARRRRPRCCHQVAPLGNYNVSMSCNLSHVRFPVRRQMHAAMWFPRVPRRSPTLERCRSRSPPPITVHG